jgi:HK97 family phage portal protein
MERKIVGKSGVIGYRDFTTSKSSHGFIYDTMQNDYLSPEYYKVTDADAYKLYRGNEWVTATVNRIVSDCTKVKPKVVLKDKSMKMKPRHQRIIDFMDDFFNKPNPNKESFNKIRQKFIRDMLVTGKGCIEKVFDGRKILQEIYALKSASMTVKADEHGTLPDKGTYVQTTKLGKEIYFDKNEVMWAVLRPISGSMYGEKPLDTLANAVASDILRATYNSNFFINGAELGGVLSLEGMNKVELQKFKQYLRDNHKGVRNAHRMLAVNVPINLVKTAITNRDLQFSEYGKELRDKIFAVYNMQPFVMGVVDSGTGKLNSGEQVQIYKDGALKPILEDEAYIYTTEILWDGFGLNEFQIVFEGIDLADTIKQAEIDRSDIASAILTINEVRARKGLQPVPWGETPICVLPGGSQIDPKTGLLMPPSTQGDNPSGKKPAGKPANKPTADNTNDNTGKSSDEEEFVEGDFSVEIAEDFMDGINDSEKYPDLHKQAMYEGIMRELSERYKNNKLPKVSDVKKSVDEILYS